jgi:hypothetical protein
VSRSKRVGTAAETLVVNFLRLGGFRYAERRALMGTNDCGDVTGIPGVVVEVKAHRELKLAEWMDETEAERANAAAALAVCWHKRRGKGSPGEWYVTMTGAQFLTLLQDFCDVPASPAP